MNIPLSQPEITESDIDAVVAALRSSRLSLGPRMIEFEQAFATYVGVPHGVAVSSGTAGLHLCVRALGIGPGDEVIVPSFTFIAAANAIRYEGASPVFVDIDAETLNLDPVRVEEAITPRTRAIMVVHTFGRPAEMEALLDIARRHGLLVIEDACEAIGAEIGGRRVGSFGDAAVFAFYPNKQITTGEGGMVVTRDTRLATELRALRNQGRHDSDAWHQHSVLGFNYRLSEISCALGIAQMRRIEDILARRAMAADLYTQVLSESMRLQVPASWESAGRVSWFVYVVRLDDHAASGLRDRVAEMLAAEGIQCGRYFAPVHQQPAYASCATMQGLPVTEEVSRRTLALPFFTGITPEQIDYVSRHLERALGSLG